MKIYDLSQMSINGIAKAVAMDDELRLKISDNMKEYGGGFVKALGECLLRADYNNRKRIVETFADYVLAYQPSKWPELPEEKETC